MIHPATHAATHAVHAAPLATGCPCARPCTQAEHNSPLMRHGESFRIERGDKLWTVGDEVDSVIVLCTGVIKLSRPGADGRDNLLDLVFRGGIIGEEAARPAEVAVRYATATALSSGRAMRLSAERLRGLVSSEPALLMALYEQSCRRMMAFTQRLDDIGHGQVENRLARVLLRIGDEVGLKDARGTFVPLRLSRGDLADMVGCRVETTIRVMTRWQREGVVETQREGLVIRDRGQLAEAAHRAA